MHIDWTMERLCSENTFGIVALLWTWVPIGTMSGELSLPASTPLCSDFAGFFASDVLGQVLVEHRQFRDRDVR
jgi:hypothetical protein